VSAELHLSQRKQGRRVSAELVLLIATSAHLRRVAHDAPCRQLDSSAFPQVEEPVLAGFWLAATGVFDESDDPRAGTGVIGLPRLR
jgi:hypothetical protein